MFVKALSTELGDDLPFWFDQLGSFDRMHIVKHLDGAYSNAFIISEMIDTVPLHDILDKHGGQSHIDLIHIDTEGHDYTRYYRQ